MRIAAEIAFAVRPGAHAACCRADDLDLADVTFIDVTGLRALREHGSQGLTIAAASQTVQRIVGLLGWDTDPSVAVAA